MQSLVGLGKCWALSWEGVEANSFGSRVDDNGIYVRKLLQELDE